MSQIKYLDIVMDAVKDVAADVKEVVKCVSQQAIEIERVKGEMSKNNEHMAEYNKQLDIHIKGVQIAHKTAAEQEKRILKNEEDISDMQKEITSKLELVYSHMEEERAERSARKRIEEEKAEKRERLYKTVRILGTISGIPLAFYGLMEMIVSIFTRF